jgi:anti-sigma regulatory factor (Ser/Thr protein kinase)
LKSTNATGLKLDIPNDADAARRSHEEVRRQIRAWVLRSGGNSTMSRQVWAATWEAVQNAIRYGSKPGDPIQITLAKEQSGLRIRVTQRRRWPAAEKEIAEARQNLKSQNRRLRLGGLVTMSNLASTVNVSNRQRTIEIHFN